MDMDLLLRSESTSALCAAIDQWNSVPQTGLDSQSTPQLPYLKKPLSQSYLCISLDFVHALKCTIML